MKKVSVVLLLVAVAFGIWGMFALAQDMSTAVRPQDITVAWDKPVLNTDGTQCTDLAGYDLALSSQGQNMNAGGVARSIHQLAGADTLTSTLEAVAKDLSDGQYQAWVRARDTAGNASVWAGPLSVNLVVNVPEQPGAFRITLLLNPDGTIRWEPAE